MNPPSEQTLKLVEAQLASQKTLHDLIAERIDAEEDVRLAKIELAKAESKLAKRKRECDQFELDAMRMQIETQEAAVKKARSPIAQPGAVVVPGGLVK